MSSAVDGRNATAQNGAVRECPTRGSSILVELSSNTAHHSELYNPDDVVKSNGAHDEHRLSCEQRKSDESPTRPTQTRPCFSNPDDQSNDSDIESPPAGQGQDHSSPIDENTKPLLSTDHCPSKDMPSVVVAKTFPPSDWKSLSDSHPSREGLNGECEGLVEKQTMDQRPSPFKSILKKSCPTTGTPSPGNDVTLPPPHDASMHQVTFHETELPLKMADAQQQDSGSSGYGLFVSIPLPAVQEERKMSRKHVAQLAAMSGCGFILVSLILAWVFSPTFL